MLENNHLDFMFTALELSRSQIAVEIGTTIQNLGMICRGEHNPSIGVQRKIEECLKRHWNERGGKTVPPEVARVVFELLYPPPPFDPFDGKLHGKKSKSKPGTTPPAPNPKRKELSEAAAELVAPDQDEGEQGEQGDGFRPTTIEGAACQTFRAPDTSNDGSTDPAVHAAPPISVQSGRSAEVGAPHASSPSSMCVAPAPLVHRPDCDITASGKATWAADVGNPTAALMPIPAGGETASAECSLPDAGREAGADPASQPNCPERGFRPTVGLNPLPERFETWKDAERAYARSRFTEGVQRHRRQLYDVIRASFANLADKTNSSLQKMLSRATGIKFRQRGKDEDAQARRRVIIEVVLPAYVHHRKENWHAKGPYDEHAFGPARASLLAVLQREVIRKELIARLGDVPSLEYCERVRRENIGKIDAHADVKDHLQMTLGFRPEYDGHVILADATGLPIRVDGAWGEKTPGTKGNRNGFQKHWLHLAVDVASAHTWIFPTFSDNEAAGWPPFLKWLLLEQLGYAPENLSVDEVSGVFTWLRDPRDERFPSLPPEVLLWLAAGSKPYIHQPGRPTGGAHAEVAVKGVKSEFARITVGRALEKELAGAGLKKARHFESQAELVQVVAELRESVNLRHLGRAGDTRVNLWNDAESAAKRALRALVPNASEIWRDIVARTKIATVTGNYVVSKSNNQRIHADLAGETPAIRAQDCPALVFPSGLRQGDDPEMMRVLLIELRAGQPLYHLAEARAAQKDKRGFDLRQPIFGEFKARPDVHADEIQKTKDAAALLHRERVAALRDGTTGETERVYE